MSKTLIIAEKPSVAKDIAAALGVPRQGDVYENDHIVVSNCIGHLVEIFTPEADDYSAKIPIIPDRFQLRVVTRTASQFSVLKKLMARSDVSCVANACDAGREGEAIFRLVYELAGCKKKMERLWLQSMTKAAIKTAWEKREPGSKRDNLADAARSRAEADWLVGINGSRACRQAVGRVMTPTLALVVDRFIANRDFKPTDYFEVFGTFGLASGEYKAKWIPAKQSDQSKLIEDRSVADAVVAKCKGVTPSSVSDESKPTRSAAPFLFDLTSLQREANKRYKFSAQKTLTIAQALYEKHKVTSYPRTDSQRLPEDYVGKCKTILGDLQGLSDFESLAKKPLDNNWVVPNKRIFDDSKISDHFAITPTGVLPSGLSSDEQKIFDLVTRRFVAIFYPDAEYTSTTRTTIVSDEVFRVSGRVLVKRGWLEVLGSVEPDDEKTPPLSALAPGEIAANKKIEVVAQKTKPPALFTEATLLTAMESAGKSLDDDELADAMKERGLGTPATRAATIEKLLDAGKLGPYMERKGNLLVPTERGIAICDHLREKEPKMISPVLTGEWEYKLLQMEKGKVARRGFMSEIESFVREMVANTTTRVAIGEAAAEPVVTPCPACGKALVSNGRFVSHESGEDCEFKLWTTISARKLSLAEINALLKNGKLPVSDGFVSKDKKKFSAGVVLDNKTGKTSFEFPKGEGSNVPCPRCKKGLLLDGRKANCDCGFSLWTSIAGVSLTPAQVMSLLEEGKTGLIAGFKSKAGKKFSASLVFDRKKESVSFDFTEANAAKGASQKS